MIAIPIELLALLVVMTAVLGLAGGYALGWHGRRTEAKDEPAEQPEPAPEEVKSPENATPFVVAGRQRKPTWRERRRELEAAARTKRQKLEEWRD